MSFTVVWRPIAERHLARIWVDSSDRKPVADAADELDRHLKTDPLNLGEGRIDATRVAFEGSIGILSDITPNDRLVAVLDVWRCRQ